MTEYVLVYNAEPYTVHAWSPHKAAKKWAEEEMLQRAATVIVIDMEQEVYTSFTFKINTTTQYKITSINKDNQ